jgi:mono/diheme cytochrome c family protein/glucose/arabinose dehydrogenase
MIARWMAGVAVLAGPAVAAETQVVFPEVTDVAHAELIGGWDNAAFERGRELYQKVCFACHGVDGKAATVQGARAFAVDPLTHQADPYSLFKTITFGYGAMPQQQWMTPAQRYDVVHYIREAFLKTSNPSQYVKVDDEYLRQLPEPDGKTADETAGSRLDFGPVLCSNLGRENPLVLTHCLPGKVAVSYDLHRMRTAGVWQDGHLDLSNTRFTAQRGEAPVRPAGTMIEGLQVWEWGHGGRFDREFAPRRPAPEDVVRFDGHFVHGEQAVMDYRIDGVRILEMPEVAETGGNRMVLRHRLHIGPGKRALDLCVAAADGQDTRSGVLKTGGDAQSDIHPEAAADGAVAVMGSASGPITAAAVIGQTDGLRWRVEGARLVLHLPPSDSPRSIDVLRQAGDEAALAAFQAFVATAAPAGDLLDVTRGGPNPHPQPLTLAGTLGDPVNGYALDTLPIPSENPYGAWLRTSALAFFDDGRCAVATYTGDIWIVSGIDEGLHHVTWQRFATGLYEPFGVLVIDGLVHVTCRDGIKRLHDLNHDGSADHYETFFADPDVSSFFHAFCFDLQRDDEGFLYYVKSGQYTDFEQPGAVLRIAPDGRSHEIFATGFRTPNGMGMLPGNLPLCSDNQGNWMPASKISLCRKGGFYGYVQTHGGGKQWAPDGGRIDPRKVVPPEGFDPPILWLPQAADNSSGGQQWLDDRRFGPLAGTGGRLFHSSFGKGWLYYLMLQDIDGLTQAACVTLPHQWEAGVQRLRVNPADGQLYGVGLSGWQGPSGGKDGCLQRLRWTGQAARLLDNVRTTHDGLELTFNFELDPAAAVDPANYQIEIWNYRWTPGYGSKFYSVKPGGNEGTDRLEVLGAVIGSGRRSVRLTIPGLVPCDQLKAVLDLRDAAGEPFRQEFHQTIHRLPADFEPPRNPEP